MDAAAQRVKAADLDRLAALRERREEESQREARIRAAARDAAESEKARAEREVAEREQGRQLGEQAIYAGLSGGGVIGLAALEAQRARLDDFGQAVVAAKDVEREREQEAQTARSAHETARAAHAVRARETRKWDRARSRIMTARRAISERAEEYETEDEIMMRFGATRMIP